MNPGDFETMAKDMRKMQADMDDMVGELDVMAKDVLDYQRRLDAEEEAERRRFTTK